MSTHPAGRRAAVKAGKPVHFSLGRLPVVLLLFPGEGGHNFGTLLSTSWSVGRGTGASIYALSADEFQTCACGSTPRKHSPVFCRFKCPCLPAATAFSRQRRVERITHYTFASQSRVPNGALPFETPTVKGGTLPSTGRIPPFSCYPALRLYRLSKSPRGLMYFNFGKPCS